MTVTEGTIVMPETVVVLIIHHYQVRVRMKLALTVEIATVAVKVVPATNCYSSSSPFLRPIDSNYFVVSLIAVVAAIGAEN
jgi:hypothetical protein